MKPATERHDDHPRRNAEKVNQGNGGAVKQRGQEERVQLVVCQRGRIRLRDPGSYRLRPFGSNDSNDVGQ
jgi:hypothetical protein